MCFRWLGGTSQTVNVRLACPSYRHGVSDAGVQKALLAIPYQMRLLWLHAYGSLVWNRVAAERVRRHGLRVVAGDAVEPSRVPQPPAGDGENPYLLARILNSVCRRSSCPPAFAVLLTVVWCIYV